MRFAGFVCRVVRHTGESDKFWENEEVSEIQDGGPAFPVTVNWPDAPSAVVAGMSLRDYFASAVLPTVIGKHHGSWITWHEDCAESAYKYADAMIAERNKTNG